MAFHPGPSQETGAACHPAALGYSTGCSASRSAPKAVSSSQLGADEELSAGRIEAHLKSHVYMAFCNLSAFSVSSIFLKWPS